VGTRAAGECFLSFFDFSQTFTSTVKENRICRLVLKFSSLPCLFLIFPFCMLVRWNKWFIEFLSGVSKAFKHQNFDIK